MDVKLTLEHLEEIPFEEWLEFIVGIISTDTDFSIKLLNEISCNHHDESWRFNAIQLQIEYGLLSKDVREFIFTNERSEEILSLLSES